MQHHPQAFIAYALSLVFLLTAAPPAHSATPVYVVGTLYKRHANVPVYDLKVLDGVIRAIAPTVLVLDVSPGELEKKEVFPSKIEYPGVIFPLLAEKKLVAYASEPAEPMFTEIVQATIKAFDDFGKSKPDLSAALTAYNEATYAVLMRSWQTPADAHGKATEIALDAKSALSDAFVGAVSADGRRRWNEHIAGVAATAAREHPGQRVLVVTGIENRGPVCALLKAQGDIELVDMERWLREHASTAKADG
jgi:hypothetical protein